MISSAERIVRVEDLEPGDIVVLDDARYRVDTSTKTADGVAVLGVKLGGAKRRVKTVVDRGKDVVVIAPTSVLDRIEVAICATLAEQPFDGVDGTVVAPPLPGDSHLVVTVEHLEWHVPLRARAGATSTEAPVAPPSATMTPVTEVPTP